jgi:hypothetical protein
MGQARFQQFADHVGHAAGGVEIVHVARAIGIDAGDQRHHAREFVHVVPVDLDAGRAGDGGQVDDVVGRTARRQQADDGVDDRLFIDAVASGR